MYQRSDPLGTERAESLIRVQHLVNGKDVTRMEAGYVDYYKLLFDGRHIIYSKSIDAEGLLFDQNAKLALPTEAQERVETHENAYSHALEVDPERLRLPNAVSLLQQASNS